MLKDKQVTWTLKRVPEDIKILAKMEAARRRQTLSEFISDAVRLLIKERK